VRRNNREEIKKKKIFLVAGEKEDTVSLKVVGGEIVD